MCIVIKQSEYTGIQTAKRDIHCYKVVAKKDGKLVPLINSQQNVVYELCKSNKEVDIEPEVRIYTRTKHIEINDGYYSVKNKKDAIDIFLQYAFQKNASIYKCVIPKGSKYVKDRKGYIVSSNIILQERISCYCAGIYEGHPQIRKEDNLLNSYESAERKFKRLESYCQGRGKLIYYENNDERKIAVYMASDYYIETLYLLKS